MGLVWKLRNSGISLRKPASEEREPRLSARLTIRVFSHSSASLEVRGSRFDQADRCSGSGIVANFLKLSRPRNQVRRLTELRRIGAESQTVWFEDDPGLAFSLRPASSIDLGRAHTATDAVSKQASFPAHASPGHCRAAVLRTKSALCPNGRHRFGSSPRSAAPADRGRAASRHGAAGGADCDLHGCG